MPKQHKNEETNQKEISMINITLKSGTYTEANLRKELSETIPETTDVTLFLKAMVNTKQVTKNHNMYTLPIEITTLAEPITLDWITYKYGEGNRIGIRPTAGWVEQYNYPHEMYYTGAYVNGVLVPVDSFYFNKIWWDASTTPLRIVKPGDETKTWRMQIPKEIISNGLRYTLPPGSQIQVLLMSTTKQYLTILKLWGYVMSYQITYDYDNPKLPSRNRHMELIGTNFINEFYADIQSNADVYGDRMENLMMNLFGSELDYEDVVNQIDEQTGEYYFDKEVTGCMLEKPLTESESRHAEVRLWGKQGLTIGDLGRIIKSWRTYQPMNKIPTVLDFQK